MSGLLSPSHLMTKCSGMVSGFRMLWSWSMSVIFVPLIDSMALPVKPVRYELMGASRTFVRMMMSLRSLKMFSVRYFANSLLTRGLLSLSAA